MHSGLLFFGGGFLYVYQITLGVFAWLVREGLKSIYMFSRAERKSLKAARSVARMKKEIKRKCIVHVRRWTGKCISLLDILGYDFRLSVVNYILK